MDNIKAFKDFTKQKYAWPGGYPMFAITNDSACLCHQCCLDNYKQIRQAQNDSDNTGWYVEAVDVNWQDPFLICDHCGESIESAYGEDNE